MMLKIFFTQECVYNAAGIVSGGHGSATAAGWRGKLQGLLMHWRIMETFWLIDVTLDEKGYPIFSYYYYYFVMVVVLISSKVHFSHDVIVPHYKTICCLDINSCELCEPVWLEILDSSSWHHYDFDGGQRCTKRTSLTSRHPQLK